MLIVNPKARNTYKFGLDNQAFASGSVHYVGSEIRAVILSKMQITEGKNLCLISAESIAVEAALNDGEGSIIAVEYNKRDRATLEDNVNQFGINNVTIIDHVDDETMKDLPVPETTMLVGSASMEQEMTCLLKLNPKMEFVIYTLDFNLAGRMNQICRELGLKEVDITQITVSKMNAKGAFDIQPAPWLITCHGE
ncbi:MAG: precorrin-6B methylase, partial [Lachnospiraceae bacterium]|nr:precorrin-6B methylase [Lachnospiraceae bacterium]